MRPPPVLGTLGAGGFADSGQSYPGHAYHDALDIARDRQIVQPRGGDVWHTDDGVTFRFYGPTIPHVTGSSSDINSNSLVFRLDTGRFACSSRATPEQKRKNASWRGETISAPTSKTAMPKERRRLSLGTVAPRDAIVSVGRNNLFGHPALASFETLRANGVTTYRDAAVTIRTDGARFRSTPFL